MSLSEDLASHAIHLLGIPPGPTSSLARNVDLRRAISAAYYALFHRISESVVDQIAPGIVGSTANRIYRWLEHGEMKKVCEEFARTQLSPPFRDLLGGAASGDMQAVALNFIRLQEARHTADYDPAYFPDWQEAREFIELAVRSIAAWSRIARSAEGNIFVLSLLLRSKWNQSRP